MEIQNAKYVVSNVDVDKCPDTDSPEYAFIGLSLIHISRAYCAFSPNAECTSYAKSITVAFLGNITGRPCGVNVLISVSYTHLSIVMATHNLSLVEDFPARLLRCEDKHLICCE